jgi:pimeloyl-ACP methyl ester carboxylesterase
MSSDLAGAARLAAVGLGAAGVMAVGAVLGALGERRLVGDRLEGVSPDLGLGTLTGTVMPVLADDGVLLHVEIDEDPGRAVPEVTVVFSHGYALSLHSWHFQRLALRAMGRLVFWDQRSHGRSARSADPVPDIDTLGADLERVLDSAVPSGPVVLVGHSMGGMTVMALAAARPDLFGPRIKGVALLATTAGGLSEVTFGLPSPISRALQRAAPGIARALTRRPHLVESGRRSGSDLGRLLTRLFSFGSPDVDPGLTAFVAQMIEQTPVEVIAEFLPALQHHDKAEALAALDRVETLVMVGDADLLTPAAHSEEIIRRVPGAELVVLPAVGHMLTLERHEEVNRHLGALIDRVRRAEMGPQ